MDSKPLSKPMLLTCFIIVLNWIWLLSDNTPLRIINSLSPGGGDRIWMCYFQMHYSAWWHHQTETISALLDLCAGNSPVTSKFPAKRPVTRSFDVSFDLCLNKRLSKQSWGWWFETPSCSVWRHRDGWSFSLTFLVSLYCLQVNDAILYWW